MSRISTGYLAAEILHKYLRVASVELPEQSSLFLYRKFGVLVNGSE